MEKICFVISPMGEDESPARIRADFVLKTYIEPACQSAGYKAVRAEHQDVQNLADGITTALQNAPLTIAYLGAPQCGVTGCGGAMFWNANVMIEIGYRIASRLPIILLSDRDGLGRKPNYPLSLSTLNVILLPGPRNGPTPHDWVDGNPKPTVDTIGQRIEAEERRVRLLDCKHPLASINANTRDTDSPEALRYTAASEAAEDLFGVEDNDLTATPGRRRLVGRTMVQYLDGVRDRMHPVQWKMFRRDQIQARKQLKDNQKAVANVPIVFEQHDNWRLNHRAYLPVIVQEYQPDRDGENNWYNLRVLYLNVTTVTKKVRSDNGEEYYKCDLDPFHEGFLEPLKPFEGIKVFISYARRNFEKLEPVLTMLRDLQPYVDKPFIDQYIAPGARDIKALQKAIDGSELFVVLLDSKDPGPGQDLEIDVLIARAMDARGRSKPIVPVVIGDSANVPTFLDRFERVQYDQLTPTRLKGILMTHFEDRCPDEWARNQNDGGGGGGSGGTRDERSARVERV